MRQPYYFDVESFEFPREFDGDEILEAPPTIVPTPGQFYAIQYGKGGLLKTAEIAYKTTSKAERLKRAQEINNHPQNQKFWRTPGNDFERKNFPAGIIDFNPNFTCDKNQHRAKKGEKKCFARIWIPSIETPTPKPRRSRPSSVWPPRPTPPTPGDPTKPHIKPKPKPKPRVVFIPGFMGSKLAARKASRVAMIWDPPRLPDVPNLIQLGNGFNNGGNVVPIGIIEFGKIYEEFLNKLRSETELLEFSYDWRISNTVNAFKLRDAIRRRWTFEKPLARDTRVSIVAHSMGGLLARYFIELLGGFQNVKCLIAVGTPHLGVPEAYLGFRVIGRPFF